ncbi:MAG: diacylglycerol kinase family lipid kinase [Coprothermobacterota bacterium]|nr:diacylglycerol kinase family lipid kinase [Coprothermobacterota bacterium]
MADWFSCLRRPQMKTFIIVNPTAGRGKGLKLVPSIEARLKSLGLDYTLHISESPSAPAKLARQAIAHGFQLVVAGGGDGTCQAVATAMLGEDRTMAAGPKDGDRFELRPPIAAGRRVSSAGSSPVFGILPMGRGNDLAHGLGIPADPLEACQVLLSGHPADLDVGVASNGKMFLNVAGAGFDAEVNRYANRIRWFKGNLVYLLAIFVKLATFRSAQFTLHHDGGTWVGKAMMVAVGNSRYYGGGLFVAPQALPDDGRFDVVIIGDLSRMEFIRAFPTVYKGTHIHHPKVQTFRTSRITIDCDAPYCSYADGDFLSELPVSLDLLPRAIKVLVK